MRKARKDLKFIAHKESINLSKYYKNGILELNGTFLQISKLGGAIELETIHRVQYWGEGLQ